MKKKKKKKRKKKKKKKREKRKEEGEEAAGRREGEDTGWMDRVSININNIVGLGLVFMV